MQYRFINSVAINLPWAICVDHPYSIETELMYVILGNNLNDDTFVFALIWFIAHCASVSSYNR